MKNINATLTVRGAVTGLGPYTRMKLTLSGDNLEKSQSEITNTQTIKEEASLLAEKLIELLNAEK